ncbi:hypothetical protein NUW58_g3182 [Xylaria curta]|uniref:Uncharacterized protein n=1 Tax=Xylaria curta TaxID=42375 RepID=A0ACC1PF79_9PEZI|nr:hypothetical protein NUW58_g3182 [Xylaria curta]
MNSDTDQSQFAAAGILSSFSSPIVLQHPRSNDPTSQVTGLEPMATQSQENSFPPNDNEASAAPSRRQRYRNLDWEGHKQVIQRLYLDDKRELADTMKIMKEQHSFEASTKLYKDRFKIWGWQKNLPAGHAHFMANKAKKRSLEEGKSTVFTYGGQSWSEDRILSSAMRSKRARTAASEIDDMETPTEISYETPMTIADSHESRIGNIEDDDSDSTRAANTSKTLTGPRLIWNGYTRASLLVRKTEALRLLTAGEYGEAENILVEVRDGLTHIIGAHSEDSAKVGYALAELYAQSDRDAEASQVIEDMTERYIVDLGYENKKTQQHILHCVELLNGWNRTCDAIAFLNRCWELLQKSTESEDKPQVHAPSGRYKKGKSVMRKPTGNSPSTVVESISMEADYRQIDYAIDVAKSYNEAKDQSAEALLLRITHICEQQIQKFPIQTLKARSELLKFYITRGRALQNEAAFENSRLVFKMVWGFYDWREEKFESFELMETALQLGAYIYKGGFPIIAEYLFNNVLQASNTICGYDDERTIWTLITIGMVYQKYATWNEAKNWFENAFAAVLSSQEWSHKDGIVRSLQNAIDKRHFSYVTDEGRPWKTIFGVSGITIRPGRLHLD